MSADRAEQFVGANGPKRPSLHSDVRPMRAVIPFIVTILLVSVLAPVVGLLLFSVLTGTPLSAGSRDLAGVPFLFYAARFALPIALPASIVIALLATAFSYGFGRHRAFWIWAVTFAVLGLVLGVVCASPMVLACIREDAAGLGGAWLFLGAACGVVIMALLSGLWYLFFRVT